MQEEGQDGSVVSQPAIMMRIRARDGMGLVIKAGFTFRFFTFLPSSPTPIHIKFQLRMAVECSGRIGCM